MVILVVLGRTTKELSTTYGRGLWEPGRHRGNYVSSRRSLALEERLQLHIGLLPSPYILRWVSKLNRTHLPYISTLLNSLVLVLYTLHGPTAS